MIKSEFGSVQIKGMGVEILADIECLANSLREFQFSKDKIIASIENGYKVKDEREKELKRVDELTELLRKLFEDKEKNKDGK